MAMFQTVFQPMMKLRSVEADASEPLFRVKATGGGALAQMLGMGSKASLTINEEGFRLQKTTFGSDENTYIPRQQIASTVCVAMKPLEMLVLGLATLPLFGLGIIFIVMYFIGRRRVIVGVVSCGGTVESLKLKATDDQLEDIREGMAILDDLIRERGGSSAERSERPERPAKAAEEKGPSKPWDEPRKPKPVPAPAPAPAPAADATRIISCPACGTRMSVPASAAGRKVRCTSCREVFPVPAA